ncbi:MAG TPA: DUF5677 domain-containing protein [Candidatus Eisenbacteria bacterium]|nr:DUF5677 domain-containing protein [Candidatus Eisenbacteria bacterium]
MIDESKFEDLLRAIDAKIRQELRLRCEAYTPDFRMPEVFNVLTALLARQATLAIELTSAPRLWNGHSAPLFLRAMTDVHITLSWILLDPKERARQYIEHGLGQAVLEVEHRKKKLESAEEDAREDMMQMIRAYESWINTQRWSFLVEVNVDAWSGKTTREMAEESGILDFYNYVYTPFSQCAHSTWYHVGRYNSSPSESPLTGQLWVPRIVESPSDVWNLSLVAKYLDKSFNIFDEKALGRAPSSRIRDWISDEIEARFGSEQDEHGGSIGVSG